MFLLEIPALVTTGRLDMSRGPVENMSSQTLQIVFWSSCVISCDPFHFPDPVVVPLCSFVSTSSVTVPRSPYEHPVVSHNFEMQS